jgi:hypothetical protein
VEELLFGHLARLGVVADEHQLDVLVLGADELEQQEEEAAREVLLHAVHGARGVHDADHHRVGLLAGILHQALVGQILAPEREALLAVLGQRRGTRGRRRLGGGGRDLAPDARLGGAPAIEMHAHAGLAIALALGDALRHHLPEDLTLHVGELEILEHDLDQLLERDVGLVEVEARLVARAPGTLAALRRLAYDLPGLGIALARADLSLIVAEHEPVLLDAADRHLDDPVLVPADDRLLGDDVGDVVANRLAQLLAMALPVAGAAVRAQRLR